MVADHAGRAIENARRFEEVARAARTDALTGLGHHGALMEALGEVVAEANGGAVGLVMLDLDDFKQVNDRHGHLAGDAVLAEVAARLRREVRVGEQAYRYGGEEFAVLLPGADRRVAVAVGERVRRAIGGAPFALRGVGRLPLTCSVGVASLPADARDGRGLVAAADAALLRSKAAGKNRVEAA
jgi:diguanylate cyclase (GGDEF)-like protein